MTTHENEILKAAEEIMHMPVDPDSAVMQILNEMVAQQRKAERQAVYLEIKKYADAINDPDYINTAETFVLACEAMNGRRLYVQED